MIQVTVTYRQNHLTALKCTGHAGAEEKGRDLVCAGVSCILFGLANALDAMAVGNYGCEIHDSFYEAVIGRPDQITDTILNTGLIQLKTLQEGDGKGYIRIRRRMEH